MKNKYSKLSIEREKIKDWIDIWCQDNLDCEYEIIEKDIPQRIKYEITTREKNIKIDFIKCNEGLLTISPNVGTCKEISSKIADSILSRVNNINTKSPFSNGFSIVMEKNIFDIIVELISELDGVELLNFSEQNIQGQATYILYRYKGPAGDCVTIKYYTNTNRMQMQGKPLWLFNEIISLVTETGAPLNDVVDAHLHYCQVEISKNDIYEEMECILGKDLFNYLSDTQKAILASGFIFFKIDVPLYDYSGIIQQTMRAFEGFAKKVFCNYGLTCDGEKDNLGKFFDSINCEFVMNPNYEKLVDEKIKCALTQMYKFYNKHRHPYSHASAYDFTTTIIEDRNICSEIFSEIIRAMQAWHADLCK